MTPAQFAVLADEHRRVQSGKPSATRRQGNAGDLLRLAGTPMGG